MSSETRYFPRDYYQSKYSTTCRDNRIEFENTILRILKTIIDLSKSFLGGAK